MEFYLYLNGAQRGPFTEERVQALIADGVLLGSDLAAGEPGGEWRALSTFRRFTVLPHTEVATSQPHISDRPADILAPSPVAVVPAPPAAVTPTHSSFIPPSALPRVDSETLGPYARATLAPSETPFYRTSLHWFVFVRFALLALLALVFIAMPLAIGVQILTGSQIGWFALPLPAFILLPPTLAFASSELVITDQRVLIKTGIVTRQSLEMFIPRIESVGVHQSVLGRMLDFGTVSIRGMGGSEEAFEAIAHPIEFRNTIQRLQGGALKPRA